MNRPSDSLRKALPSIIFLSLTALGTLAWRLIAAYWSDDYFYRFNYEGPISYTVGHRPITTLSDVAEAYAAHYVGFNSRLTHLWVYLCALLPDWLVDAACAVMIMAMLWLLMRHVGRGFWRSPLAATLAATLMWTVLPWSDSMTSYDFEINYIWSTVMLLGFLVIYLERCRDLSRGAMWLTALLAFLAGWMHEGLTVPALAGCAWVWLTGDRPLRRRRLALMAALAAGLAVVMGPGTFVRISNGGYLTSDFSDMRAYFTTGCYPMLPWLLAGAAALTLRLIRGKGSVKAAMEGASVWVVIAVTSLAIGWLVRFSERAVWFNYVAIVILTLKPLAPLCRGTSRAALAMALALALANAAFIVEVCRWQRWASDDQTAMLNRQRATGEKAFYTSAPLETRPPWWTLGIPQRFDGTNGACHATYSMMSGASVMSLYPVLPDSLAGKPYAQWPKVPGRNPFRGVYPCIYCDHPIADGQWTRSALTFGEPLSSMTPLDRLISAITGRTDVDNLLTSTRRIECSTDTALYRVSLTALPRSVRGRRFIALDLQ